MIYAHCIEQIDPLFNAIVIFKRFDGMRCDVGVQFFGKLYAAAAKFYFPRKNNEAHDGGKWVLHVLIYVGSFSSTPVDEGKSCFSSAI